VCIFLVTDNEVDENILSYLKWLVCENAFLDAAIKTVLENGMDDYIYIYIYIYVHVCWLKWVTPVHTAFFNTTPYHMNLVVHPGIRLPYLHVFWTSFAFAGLVWSGQNLSYKLGYSPGYNLAYLDVLELNYLHLEWCSPSSNVNSEPMDISVGGISS
jgi:hypothetical protein